jgi:hypothetical protein
LSTITERSSGEVSVWETCRIKAVKPMTINEQEAITINQKPRPKRKMGESGQNTCPETTIVNDTIPSKNKTPKKAASLTLPTTHQPLMRWPRFFPQSRIHFAT